MSLESVGHNPCWLEAVLVKPCSFVEPRNESTRNGHIIGSPVVLSLLFDRRNDLADARRTSATGDQLISGTTALKVYN
jgi:hypothetical protein